MVKELLIFRKIKQGDIRAFEFLFRQYYAMLCRYACKLTGNMDVAEEIVQELFYKFWRDREKRQILLSVKSYLYGAVRNNALQHLERSKREQNYQQGQFEKQKNSEYAPSPHDALVFKELEKNIAKALQNLPERRQQIFCMNRFDGKTYVEIAEVFSLSVKTVEVEMSKALKVLKKEMKKY